MKNYSGQLRLRLPTSLHRSLAEKAQIEGVSLNTYLIYLISKNYGEATMATIMTATSSDKELFVGDPDNTYKSSTPLIQISVTPPKHRQ